MEKMAFEFDLGQSGVGGMEASIGKQGWRRSCHLAQGTGTSLQQEVVPSPQEAFSDFFP